MPELLAPAGDLAAVETALYFGADAVYCGGPALQLRSDKAGLSRPQLEQAVAAAHEKGKKLYVALNSLAFDSELKALPEYAGFLQDIGVDAVIVADLGVMAVVRRCAPRLQLHVSTQFNCMNHQTALALREFGARRIVLARELTLEQIATLRSMLPRDLELEAFVHGAMCMAFSGRCLMSSFMAGRSGNRGECAQPCRWSYSFAEEKRPGEVFDAEQTEKGTAIFSSHDLCAIDLLQQLEEAGVCSFKIEGRMKSEYYVATVVNAYRMGMEHRWSAKTCRSELEKVTHRPYSEGFLRGFERITPTNDGRYRQECVFAARVLEDRGDSAVIQQRNPFFPGEELELLSPGREPAAMTVGELRDLEGQSLEGATLVQQKILIKNDLGLKPGDILRKSVPLKVF